MLFAIGLLALMFLIPAGVSLGTSSRSRRHSDRSIIGLFAGSTSVGLIIGCIAVTAFFAPGILTTGVGFLAACGVVIAVPAAMMWLTRGWLRH